MNIQSSIDSFPCSFPPSSLAPTPLPDPVLCWEGLLRGRNHVDADTAWRNTAQAAVARSWSRVRPLGASLLQPASQSIRVAGNQMRQQPQLDAPRQGRRPSIVPLQVLRLFGLTGPRETPESCGIGCLSCWPCTYLPSSELLLITSYHVLVYAL